jgi:hypothetical protein
MLKKKSFKFGLFGFDQMMRGQVVYEEKTNARLIRIRNRRGCDVGAFFSKEEPQQCPPLNKLK